MIIICGIVTYWAKEAVLDKKSIEILLEGASKRGRDGLGITIWDTETKSIYKQTWLEPFDKIKDSVVNRIFSLMCTGNILSVSCRATPETEPMTTTDMIQPIVNINEKFILTHNGGVTDSLRTELGEYKYLTKIDSEMIIACYEKNHFNMKNCMEQLTGSFAFTLIDVKKDKLYAITSFNPLAHMYIRGYGYFLHSDNDCLADVLKNITGQSQDGVRVWESWYHHYLEPYTIIETDLENGFQFKQKFVPRFLHPVQDNEKTPNKTEALVVCSGGIDSGLTAYILSKLGYAVTMLHFNYGAISSEAELWAVKKQAEHFGCKLKIIDIQSIYTELDDNSMLIKKEIGILSGGDMLKSTIAWVSQRNTVFASITLALAESMILKNQCNQVIISAGWNQLSEETNGFPDNSFYFNRVLNELKDVGGITGSKIKFVPLLQNITKTEAWLLGKYLDFPFHLTVSCDSPKMVNDVPVLCIECGSTKLSILASDRADVPDKRYFNKTRPLLSKPVYTETHPIPIRNIVDRLILNNDYKEVLKKWLYV